MQTTHVRTANIIHYSGSFSGVNVAFSTGLKEGAAKAAIAPGALDSKTKELIAIAIAIATRCDGCIGFHAKAAIRAGASREEVLETISMAIYMGAGPSMIYAAEALRAFDELAPASDAGA